MQSAPGIPASVEIVVYLTCTTLLQTEVVQDGVKPLLVLGQVGDLDVHATTETGSEVAGAHQDVAQVLVPHVGVALGLDGFLNLKVTATTIMYSLW